MAPESQQARAQRWREEDKRITGVLGMTPNSTPIDENKELARAIVDDDRIVHDAMSNGYNLPRQTVDALLSHAREDAAWAALNTGSIWKELRIIKRLLIAILIAALAIAYKSFLSTQ